MLVKELKIRNTARAANVLLCETLHGRYVHFYRVLPYQQLTFCQKVFWRHLHMENHLDDEVCPQCLKQAHTAIQGMGATWAAPQRKKRPSKPPKG